MKNNTLTIRIERPVHDVFSFVTTPPNSSRWIPSVVAEEINEWPVRIGTIYILRNEKNEVSNVAVTAIKNDEFIEWVSEDRNYHCRYIFKASEENSTIFEYSEWMDEGDLKEPFTSEVLQRLKTIVEKDSSKAMNKYH